MGDHRADIKIEFTMHGKTYKFDARLNWAPDDDGIDCRIVEWFGACWSDAKRRYDEAVWESQQKQREQETERKDHEELARLKAKYEVQ